MKKLRWQLIIIFLTGLVVGVLLLGEQPGGLKELTPAPARGGVYTEGLIGTMQRLNPLLDYYNPVDRDVDHLLYSGLIRFDDQGMPQPDLAESWGVSKDGTLYNLSLHKNIVWHDGEPLTTDDIVFTVGLLKNGGDFIPEDLQTFWSDVEVIALSEDTLQFKLPEAFAPFLDYLNFGILPRHILGDISIDQMVDSQFNLQPVGTGPYMFDRMYVENGQITGVGLKLFESYFGNKPFIEQVIFRYLPDDNAAFQAYLEEKIQGISEVSRDLLPQVLNEPGLSLYTSRKPELSMVLFNLTNPEVAFFQDVSVRKALMTGLNRQWQIDNILGGQAILADGPVMPGSWAHYNGLEPIKYDSQAAVEILKQAGYVYPADSEQVRKKEDTSLKMTLIYPETETHRLIAESIKSDWRRLGVLVDLEPLPYEELINGRLAPRSYQAALVDLNLARSPDPDPYPFWDQAQATGGQNYSQWNNRIASEYLEQARVTADVSERARLYRNFQVVFNDEIPSLMLYYPVYSYAVDQAVKGVQACPLYDTSDRFSNIAEWYLIARVVESPSG